MNAPESFLLTLLRCPLTHSKLQIMSVEQLERLNDQIRTGKAKDHEGRLVTVELNSALINSNGSQAYSIRGGIMQLIADQAIELEPSFLNRH